MNMLMTAVVDITTLVAACHALKALPPEGEVVLERKTRQRLRRDLKRGTVAYINALARGQTGVVDDDCLNRCRLAAELQMASALASQALLSRIMAIEAGSLEGLAATRQDLWRLAHGVDQLNASMADLRASPEFVASKAAEKLVKRLRRRLRKALVAYARTALRDKAPRHRLTARARAAAWAEIGPRGTAEAQELTAFEASVEPTSKVLRQRMTKLIDDLALDWQQQDPTDD